MNADLSPNSAIEAEIAMVVGWLKTVIAAAGEPAVAASLPFWSLETEEVRVDAGAPPLAPAGRPSPARLAQAVSIAFQVVSAVEDRHAAQARLLARVARQPRAFAGTFDDQLARLADLPAASIVEAFSGARAEAVLTAHPTEAKRQTVLEHHRRLADALSLYAGLAVEDPARIEAQASVEAALDLLWRTGEIYLAKPDLASELRAVRHYLAEVFPAALPALRVRLEQAWRGAGLPGTPPRPGLSFGTWVGGDRDGHPGVTAEVTARTLQILRTDALDLLSRELSAASRRLSLSALIDLPGSALMARIETLSEALGPAGAAARDRNPDEPWRTLLNLMVAALAETRRTPSRPGAYRRPAELDADLALLEEDLEARGAHKLAAAALSPLRDLVATFGFHLARLDLRQNSRVHDLAFADLLVRAGLPGAEYPEWPEADRLALLRSELASPRPFAHDCADLGPESRGVVGALRAAAEAGRAWGFAGLGALIVSMTRQLSDLLVVYLFAREAGLWLPGSDGPICPLQVVPLLETIDDLERGPEIVEALLGTSIVARSLAWQAEAAGEDRSLQVMVGYSDSNKDGGLWASRWAVHRAQERIARIGAAVGVRIRFFHGRGGTIARGAGPIHRFLRALPRAALRGDLRLTEQGEVLAARYGDPETAAHHLELLLASVGGATARHAAATAGDDPLIPIPEARFTPPPTAAEQDGRSVASPHKSWFDVSTGTPSPQVVRGHAGPAPVAPSPRPARPRYGVVVNHASSAVAAHSRTAYEGLVRAEGFVRFFSQATPIDAIEVARIGSRPARRTGERTLADLRAIPWVFAWSQARFALSGWFGAGSGLTALEAEEPGAFRVLTESAFSHPTLHGLVSAVATAVMSSDPHWMAAYAQLVEDEALRDRFMGVISAERARTEAMLERIYGGPLAARRRNVHATLARRQNALGVLHGLQIDRLSAWRAARASGDPRSSELELEMLLTVNAIAAGLGSTG